MSHISTRKQRSGQISTTSHHIKQRKPKARRKPEWDSTVNDLTILKASPDEIDRRRAVHKSQNLDVVKEMQLQKKIAKARLQSVQQESSDSRAKHVGIIRELLCDDSQLQEALAASDRLLDSAKNILGEDPKRYKGLPNVTRAPNQPASSRQVLPDDTLSQPSKMDILSDSIMANSALNDSTEEGESGSESESDPQEVPLQSFQPHIDLARFQKVIHELEKEKDGGSKRNAGKSSRGNPAIIKKTANNVDSVEVMNVTPVGSPQKQPAMNDTEKVKRTKSRVNATGDAPHSLPTMDDLNLALSEIRNNLNEYEQQSGRNLDPGPASITAVGFSGYTVALLDTVLKMSHYLRENDIQSKIERAAREVLMKNMDQLQTVVNTLTNSLITVQQEYSKLQNEFVKQKRETEQQMLILRRALSNCGVYVPTVQSMTANDASPPNSNSQPGNIFSNPSLVQLMSMDRIEDPKNNSLPTNLPVEPAVMLVPPHQSDSPASAGGRLTSSSNDLEGIRTRLVYEAVQEINEPTRNEHHQSAFMPPGILQYQHELIPPGFQMQQSGSFPPGIQLHQSDSLPSGIHQHQSGSLPSGIHQYQSGSLPSGKHQHQTAFLPPSGNQRTTAVQLNDQNQPSFQHILDRVQQRTVSLPPFEQHRTANQPAGTESQFYVQTANGRESNDPGAHQELLPQPGGSRQHMDESTQQRNFMLAGGDNQETSRLFIRQQLAELNRQQADAQQKLQKIIERQQMDAMRAVTQSKYQTVSPPISPITVSDVESAAVPDTRPPASFESNDRPSHLNPVKMGAVQGSLARQVKVTIPRADQEYRQIVPSRHDQHMVDQHSSVEPDSIPSAKMISMPIKPKSLVQKNEGWFALTSHVAST